MPKQTQQAAGYTRGHPMTQCGVCDYYRKEAGQFGKCERVTGKITAYGVCQRFLALNNPWGNRLTSQSRTALANLYDQIRGGPGR